MADNPSVTVLVMVAAGSKYETKEQSGLSHFLEHMVFKGTARRPKASDISRELDGLGAQYNAFTAQEFTGYYVKAATIHFDKILDVISDMYQNPLFDPSELAKEKGVIIEEIRMYNDLPQQHVRDLFFESLYGDQPAGWNIAGTIENVKTFDRQALISYRDSHYVSNAMSIIVAGSIDTHSVEKSIEKAFSKALNAKKSEKVKVIEKQDEPKITIEFKDTDQTHIVIGVRTFPIDDQRMPVMRVLSAILGYGMSSRLFSKLRDELGICYYVKADNESFTDHGVFTVSAGVDNSRIKEAIENILAICGGLGWEKVSDAELQKVKDHIAGTMLLELETSESRAEYCGYQDIVKNNIELPEEIVNKINGVNADHVMDLARQIFVNRNLNLAVIGKIADSDILRSYFKFESR
jgi:predicted Zn-dependent peptidase